MAGIFDLVTPKDLLLKLKRELDRLRSDPINIDHAFNYFTTAEHMLDWLYPGDAGRSQRKNLRNSDPMLLTVSHLANGAKHFDKLGRHHRSVRTTERRGGYWAKSFWAKEYWGKRYWAEPRLSITLSGPAAQQYGAEISAIDLAENVFAYWNTPSRIS